jgi:hypothetical protein
MFGWLRKSRGDAAPTALDAAFRRADKVVSAREGDRTVLLDPVRGEYYGLDEVGTRVWELLPDHPTAAALADRLLDEYDAPRERLTADTAALLGKLRCAWSSRSRCTCCCAAAACRRSCAWGVHPFHAHAWVELDGEPVNEDRETVDKFRALPEVAA